jgi:16S rRNA (guanine527-N7)-methyltransferase
MGRADMGSGAGFPGLVMGICLAENSSGHVHLIESNGKKAAFLRAAVLATGASATVHSGRVESTCGRIQRPDFVSARALASLDLLLTLAEPWLAAGSTAFFHKGRDYRREVETARDRWVFDLLEHRSDSHDESVVLEIGGLRRR